MKSQSENKQNIKDKSNATEGSPGRMAGYGGRDAEKLERNLKATSQASKHAEEEE